MNVACLVPSYNHPLLSARAIQSLLDKNFIPSDIFLVHDGPEQSCIQKLKSDFPSINHLVTPKNLGFSGAVNCGLISAMKKKYQWYFIMSNDAQLLEFVERPPHPGLVAVKVMGRKYQLVESLGGVLNFFTGSLKHLKVASRKIKFYQKFYVPGAAFLIHHSVLETVGLLDENLFIYFEDVEYSLRVQKKMLPIYLFEGVCVSHQGRKTTGGNSLYTTYYFQRNRKKVCIKYGYWWSKIIFFVIFFSQNLIKLIRLKKKQRQQKI